MLKFFRRSHFKLCMYIYKNNNIFLKEGEFSKSFSRNMQGIKHLRLRCYRKLISNRVVWCSLTCRGVTLIGQKGFIPLIPQDFSDECNFLHLLLYNTSWFFNLHFFMLCYFIFLMLWNVHEINVFLFVS